MDTDVSKLIDKFVKSSVESWDAERAINTRKYNQCQKNISKVYDKLKELNKTTELFPLIYHDHQSVRFNAAFYLIPEFPKESREVIEETSKLMKCWLGSSAETTLKLWDKGDLWILKSHHRCSWS